jgi:hypothetical protein
MADNYDDLGHAELDELLEPAGLSKSGNLDEKRARLREHDAEQAEAEQPVTHPRAAGYVLQDGQWVLVGEHGPELLTLPESETEESEE